MRLVVDTNILVAELLRKRGRDLIISKNLELFLAEKMKDEVQYELQKRISIIVALSRDTCKIVPHLPITLAIIAFQAR